MLRPSMKYIIAVGMASLIVISATLASHAAGLDVSVGRDRIAEGESFRLSLSADTNDLTQAPDISPLNKDFDILGTSRSSRTRIVNGVRSDRQQWIITLAPKTRGTLTIPQLSAGKATSEPLTIEVVDPSHMPTPQTAGGPSITAEISDGSHYIQQEIPVTVRVTTAPGFRGGEIIAPQSSDYILTQSGTDTTTPQTIGGKRVSVIERTYLLRPQTSGTLKIAPFTLRAEMDRPNASSPFPRSPFGGTFGSAFGGAFEQMFNPGRQITLRSAPITLDVKASPGAQSGWFLPAKAVKLSATWEPANPTFRVGEAVTRRVTLQALGAAGVQLPDIAMPDVPGARIYAEDSTSRTADTPDGTAALREFEFSVVPTSGGRITLPEISVEWFDTGAEETRHATLPAETIEVQGPVAAPPQPAAAQPASAVSSTSVASAAPPQAAPAPWWWDLGIGAVLAAVLVGYALVVRERAVKSDDRVARQPAHKRRKAALHKVEAACKARDPHAAYAHALEWRSTVVEALGPDSRPISDQFPDLRGAWRTLEECVFAEGDTHAWDAASFLAQLKAADRKVDRGEARHRAAPALPALYPGMRTDAKTA